MKNHTRFLYCSVLISCLLPAALFAVDTPPATTDESATDPHKEALDDRYDELKDLAKREQRYRDILDLKQKERAIIAAQITRIDSESAQIEQNIKKNEDDITTLTQELDRIHSEILQKEQLIILQKAVLAQFLRERYQDFAADAIQQSAFWRLLDNDANAHGDRLAHASASLSDYVTQIHSAQEALKNDQGDLERRSQEIRDAKYQLEQRNEHLENSRNYKSVLATQVAVDESKYQNRLNKVLQEQLAIQQEITDLANNHIGNFSLADLPKRDKADFATPVKKPYIITQGYGKTSFSSNYKGGLHNGIDYTSRENYDILAVADGTIKATGDMGKYGYGRWVAIDHGNGLITLYGHFSSVKVSRGKKIKKGDTIGTMGSTGFSTGTHLHFSVFVTKTFGITESSAVKDVFIPSGATVNPNLYL